MTPTVPRWSALAVLALACAPLLFSGCNSGNSGSSGSGTITTGGGGGGGGGGGSTADTTPPLDVTDFDVIATGVSGQVSMTWTPSASLDTARYQVTWVPATGPAQPVTVSPASASSLVLNSLADGTPYTFTLQAIDTSGNVSAGVTDTAVPGSSSVYVAAAPHGGIYPAAVPVVFNFTGLGTVRYTTDGTDPSATTGTVWPGTPVSIAANTRLKYLLILASGPVSPVRTDIYEVNAGATPRFFKFCGMRRARVGHTSTRLSTHPTADEQDDVVLIGGIDRGINAVVNDLERYDRGFEHFDAVAAAAGPNRCYHTASLFSGGRVLAAGGLMGASGMVNSGLIPYTPNDVTATAIVYDGSTGAVAATGTMGEARAFAASARLYNDEVLVTGGFVVFVLLLPMAATNTSPSKSSIELGFSSLLGVPIQKGDLVEVAWPGRFEYGTVTDFTQGWSPDTVSVEGLVTEVQAGNLIRILRGSGTDGAERYTAGGAFVPTVGTMSDRRFGHTATLLDDGRVLVAGGRNDYDDETISDRRPDLFDRTTGLFSRTGDGNGSAAMSVNRFFHTATQLKDGKVLIAGGIDKGLTAFHSAGVSAALQASADLYDPITDTMTSVSAMSVPRFMHSATLLADGRVLLVGGYTGVDSQNRLIIRNTADLYDPVTKSFTGVLLNDVRGQNQATALSDGRALVTGGIGDFAELFLPSGNQFVATAHGIGADRTYGAASVAIPDGRVLITGGQTGLRDGKAGTVLDSAEVFSMSSIASLYAANAMSVPRRFHTATRLVDTTGTASKASWHGRILVVGGENADGAAVSCDLFDTSASRFAATGALKTARFDHAVTCLIDGRILVTGGGTTVNPLDSGELYNPATGLWSDAANTMSRGRTQHAAVLLPPLPAVPAALRGKVLIMGGSDIDDATAELFDPADNLFKPLPGGDVMGAGRRGFSAAPRTYSRGLARFTNGSALVEGFGSGWLDAAIPVHLRPQAGDLIQCDADGSLYVLAAAPGADPDGGGPADASLTLGVSFAGLSTVGYQAYTVIKADLFAAGGEGGSVATDVFAAGLGTFENAGNMGTAGLHGRYRLTLNATAEGRFVLAGGYAAVSDGRLFTPAVPPVYLGAFSGALSFDANGQFIYHYASRPTNGYVLVLRGHGGQVFFPN